MRLLNLQTLDARLQQFRDRERTLQGVRRELTEELRLGRAALDSERETALDELQQLRKTIRRKRQVKAHQLSKAMGQMVEVHVRHAAESGEFFELLQAIKVGSRIPDEDIRVMANELHPVKFVKSLLTGDYDELAKVCNLDRRHFEKLHAVILEEERLDDLYEIQIANVEDRIDCRLSVGANTYKDLEALAHGQKCTVILMVALAEGDFPILADQPRRRASR